MGLLRIGSPHGCHRATRAAARRAFNAAATSGRRRRARPAAAAAGRPDARARRPHAGPRRFARRTGGFHRPRRRAWAPDCGGGAVAVHRHRRRRLRRLRAGGGGRHRHGSPSRGHAHARPPSAGPRGGADRRLVLFARRSGTRSASRSRHARTRQRAHHTGRALLRRPGRAGLLRCAREPRGRVVGRAGDASGAGRSRHAAPLCRRMAARTGAGAVPMRGTQARRGGAFATGRRSNAVGTGHRAEAAVGGGADGHRRRAHRCRP